jgi:hypothetical protein
MKTNPKISVAARAIPHSVERKGHNSEFFFYFLQQRTQDFNWMAIRTRRNIEHGPDRATFGAL